MLYFDSVICENLPEKTNLAVLCLDNLILGVDNLNELGILILERFFFSLLGPFRSRSYVLTIVTNVPGIYQLRHRYAVLKRLVDGLFYLLMRFDWLNYHISIHTAASIL